jgi:hypothetical protein
MQGMDKDTKMRVYIMDSLVARGGQVLSPTLISEITAEILARMIEIHEVPLCTPLEGLEHE